MKMRNKKLISAVVAAFLVVVMAGSAFAFGTGQLQFTGTANVASELSVVIQDYVGFPVAPSLSGFAQVAPDGKSVTFDVGVFEVPGQYQTVWFTLENNGTVPARVNLTGELPMTVRNLVRVDLLHPGLGHIPWDIRTEMHLQPGATESFGIYVALCPTAVDEFDGLVIDEEVLFDIILNYTWLND